jgi:hypothetical protein
MCLDSSSVYVNDKYFEGLEERIYGGTRSGLPEKELEAASQNMNVLSPIECSPIVLNRTTNQFKERKWRETGNGGKRENGGKIEAHLIHFQPDFLHLDDISWNAIETLLLQVFRLAFYLKLCIFMVTLFPNFHFDLFFIVITF